MAQREKRGMQGGGLFHVLFGILDFFQIKRFGAKESDLPPGSIILNRPHSLYESHRTVIWVTVGFVSLLLCVIVALLNNIRKKRQTEAVLAESRAMLRQVLDMTPQAMLTTGRS